MTVQYRVKYYYLATGMEGRADERIYGPIEAASADDACDKVALAQFPLDATHADGYSPEEAQRWFRNNLSASVWDS